MQTSITRTCDLYGLGNLNRYSDARMVLTRTRGERHEYVSASAYATRTVKRQAVRRARRAERMELRDPRTW
jgi:hypothetical protein